MDVAQELKSAYFLTAFLPYSTSQTLLMQLIFDAGTLHKILHINPHWSWS